MLDYLLPFIILILIVVFIHEYGHIILLESMELELLIFL